MEPNAHPKWTWHLFALEWSFSIILRMKSTTRKIINYRILPLPGLLWFWANLPEWKDYIFSNQVKKKYIEVF